MQKIIFYIFLISAVIAFLCGMEVTIMLSLAFYHSGATSPALQTWLSLLNWLPLLIGLLLLFKREKWAFIPLAIVTPEALKNAYLNFLYNGWPTDFNWWCNYIAAVGAVVMVIVGYTYYFYYYLQRR